METEQYKLSDQLKNAGAGFASFLDKNIGSVKPGSLVTFAFPVDNLELIDLINPVQNKFNTSLFFHSRENNYSFLAIDNLLQVSDDKNGWDQLFSEFKNISSFSVNNLDEFDLSGIPVFTGGVKFDFKRTSNEWEDFGNFNFFIPKILIYKNLNKCFLIVNLLFNNNSTALTSEYNESVNILLNLSGDSNNYLPKVTIHPAVNDTGIRNNWIEAVKKAGSLLNDHFKKVVLARRLEFDLTGNVDWGEIFSSLGLEYPECYLFILRSNDSVFFGASPEKFISLRGKNIEMDALAGSSPGSNEKSQFNLSNDRKNLTEHRYVIDFIKENMQPFTVKLTIEETPHVKRLSHVQHLHTMISAQLNSKDDMTDLLESLYPTPAVCGFPKKLAFEAIQDIEYFDRGLYSGIIGWVNFNLDAEFTVAIRSALIKNNKLYIYSGAGIVKDSIPGNEFDETKLKLKTILNLFDAKEKSK